MAPKVPRWRPCSRPPAAWAVSSSTGIPCRSAIALIASMRAGAPIMCTGRIARVFGVILRSRSAGSMFRVRSTSVNTGTAPQSRMASQVATKVNPWVMTSSPAPTPSAARATLSAAVPELTAWA